MAYRLDSRSLSLFLAVADAQSYRQAAERLHMSQPPLSRAIRELEDRIGCALFERHSRGATLTEAGRALRPYALRVDRLLRDAEVAMASMAAPRSIRLGLTSAVEPAWFATLVGSMKSRLSAQDVSVVSHTSPRLVKRLRAGRLDAACIALPTETAGLKVVEVDRLPMVVAVPSAHELARRRSVSLADLQDVPVFWMERARQPAFFDHCEQIFARHGFAPRRMREAHDQHVLLSDVAAGQGVAFLPASFRGLRRNGVSYRTLAQGDELAVGVGLATRPDRAELGSALLDLIAAARR